MFNINSYTGLFLIFASLLYSKEFFPFDEEIIIISCLFIVFLVINNTFSESLKKSFDNKLRLLYKNYVDEYDKDLAGAESFKERFLLIKSSILGLSFLFVRLKVNFLYFLSFNYELTFVFFKIMANEFLCNLLAREKAFEKHFNFSSFKKIVSETDKTLVSEVSKRPVFGSSIKIK